MKKLLLATAMLALAGCASITNDPNVPVSLSFSSNANGECKLTNKRFTALAKIPSVVMVRRSDDALKYDCETEGGRTAIGQIESTIGTKLAVSVLIDFGITDAITDKHREYPASFVIPVPAE